MRRKPSPGLDRRKTPATSALLFALACAVCALACAASGAAIVARASDSSEVEEAAAAARGALARMPPEERLESISDARVRRAVQSAYRAVVELADNREAARLSALNAKFERAFAAAEREAARSEHKICALNCKDCDGDLCRQDCKASGKKFCGCKLVVFGCIVAECLF